MRRMAGGRPRARPSSPPARPGGTAPTSGRLCHGTVMSHALPQRSRRRPGVEGAAGGAVPGSPEGGDGSGELTGVATDA